MIIYKIEIYVSSSIDHKDIARRLYEWIVQRYRLANGYADDVASVFQSSMRYTTRNLAHAWEILAYCEMNGLAVQSGFQFLVSREEV